VAVLGLERVDPALQRAPRVKDRTPPSPDAVIALIAEARRRKIEPLADALLTMSRTGVRSGEVLGLQRDDVCGRKLHVQRTLHGNGTTGPTKSGRTRWVDLSADVAAVLAGRAAVAAPPHYWLFESRRFPGRPYSREQLQKRVRGIADKLRLPGHVTPHLLRHAAACRLLEAGEDLIYVSRLLGHRDVNVTASIYAASAALHRPTAVDRLDRLYAEPEK
jgi:integrase